MTKHAKLSPSGSERWMNCPASIRMEEGLPDTSSVYAEEGTAAHEVAAICLEKELPASSQLGKVFNKCEVQSEGFKCDEEMADAVQQYIDHVNTFKGDAFFEKQVCVKPWVDEGFGHADVIKIYACDLDPLVVTVIDLKYGKGVMVEAQDNSQAGIYGLGVYNDYKDLFDFDDDTVFQLVIVMPRKDHITQWNLTLKELLEFGDRVKLAAKECENPEAAFDPGPKTCQWCKAKTTCKSLHDYNIKLAVEDFEEFDLSGEMKFKDPRKNSNDDISIILDNVDGITKWAKAIEAHALMELNAGHDIPNYKLVEGKKGDKKWKDEKEVVEIFETLFDIEEKELYGKPKILTPTKALALLGSMKLKKKDKDSVESLYSQTDGKPNIAHVSDRRIPIKPSVETDFETEYEGE